MGYFTLYDYTSVFTKAVNATILNASDLNNVASGSFTYNGSTFTLSKTSSGNRTSITILCNTTVFSQSDVPGILSAAGIRSKDFSKSIFPMDDLKLGFDSNRTDPPFYQQTYNSNNNYVSWAMEVPQGYTGITGSYYQSDNGALTPIAVPVSDTLVAIGCMTFFAYSWNNSTYLDIYYYPSLTTDNWSESSGDKGFRPTGAYTNKDNPGVGGRGTSNKKDPDYAGDPISLPGAPDESVASAVGCGFINCYKVDTANLEKVGACLYGSTLLGLIQNIATNPLDFIISLMVFPCSPNVGATENIKLGRWLTVVSAPTDKALGYEAVGARLSSQFKTVPFGSVSIPENWGNFLDYSQTNIELYLPFVGSVSIDVSECMGGTIEVEYTIDFFTGMCVANVLCTRPNYVLPSGKALTNVHAEHAYQGNCAIQIPLSAVNYGSMVGSLINACTQGITNPVAGFTGIMTDAVSGGLRPNVSSKGNIVANSGFCSVLYPYVRITRPITAEPESYQEVMGLPSYINTKLGQCEGLCVCDDIDLRSISGATENELNKIRQMCKDGVYI